MAPRYAAWAIASAFVTTAILPAQLQAADLGGAPQRPPPDYGAPPLVQVQRWSGLYVGAAAGYSFGSGETGGDIGTFSFDHDGFTGGAFAGYNMQLGSVVVGLEADIGTGDFGTSTSTGAGQISSELNYLASVRARAGFLLGPSLLVYATGGFAFADMEFSHNGASASEMFYGYQVGGGAEMMLSEHSTLRIEYVFTDLEAENLNQGGLNNTYNPDFHTVRAGYAFKF